MDHLSNDLFTFFEHLSDKDKIHFAEYMFKNLITFDLPEDYLDGLEEEDGEEGHDIVFEDMMFSDYDESSTYHISGKTDEVIDDYIHDNFFIRGYLVKVTRKENTKNKKKHATVNIFGKVLYDVCYN